jgi:arylsulfatase A
MMTRAPVLLARYSFARSVIALAAALAAVGCGSESGAAAGSGTSGGGDAGVAADAGAATASDGGASPGDGGAVDRCAAAPPGTDAGGLPTSRPEHPNFVVIMGEARGWTSTSVQQDESVADSKSARFRTPNLDAMAAEGTTFADFYAPSPRCMPSRASFFTGQSPARLHMTFIPEGNRDGATAGAVVAPVTVTNLPPSNLTVSAMLKSVGYATAHFGKWHAGQTNPSAYGFDESDGPTSNKGPDGDTTPNPDQGAATTARGLAFIERHAAAKKPFYLQISNYGGGTQEEATPESWAIESARLAGRTANDIADAAIIRDMDLDIGKVLAKLNELGLEETTYVLFTSDHGRQGTTANPPLKQGKGSIWEGGVRVPLIVRGPGIPKGTHNHVRASQVDVLPTLAELAHVPEALPASIEGGSLWRVLTTAAGAVVRSREEFVIHFPHYDKDPEGPASALYLGDFTYIRQYETNTERLYDLGADLGEQRDLAPTNPSKLDELRAKMDAYFAAVGAQLPTRR